MKYPHSSWRLCLIATVSLAYLGIASHVQAVFDNFIGGLTTDSSGNVYVTGNSFGSGTGRDYATVKYNSSGTQQWVARYNGPGNTDDTAYAIAVDASGNVYVTGSSTGSGSGFDYATVKYNSSGSQQWVARYNGPSNTDDIAYAVAVDSSGNVYVTGGSTGSGSGRDYATVKYNSSGTQQWASRYNGPGNTDDTAYALAVDGSGNVHVTGGSTGSGSGFDYATVKYNSSGTQQWASRYNGPGNTNDTAYALAIDGSGNVHVTGGSTGSGSGFDYATVKYNSSGTQQWASRYNGPSNSDDTAYDLALDASGNVHITGSSFGSGTGRDYATIKYNSSGTQQWASRYNGPGNTDDNGYAIAVDGSGNVHVTGGSTGSGSGFDYATVKYDSSGSQQWASRYNGPANSDDNATAIAVDSSGNVHVTGGSTGSGSGFDYATVKYNSSGSQQWASRYNGPGNTDDIASILRIEVNDKVALLIKKTVSSWDAAGL
jgi:uncharacterized delta-60 repeat protein